MRLTSVDGPGHVRLEDSVLEERSPDVECEHRRGRQLRWSDGGLLGWHGDDWNIIGHTAASVEETIVE